MIVTDPCYEPGTWCTAVLDVKKGNWYSEIVMTDEGDWGTRVAELIVFHEDYRSASESEFKKIDKVIGVDSGQAGFFDLVEYERVYKEGQEEWYKSICDDTMQKSQTALRSFGIASSSGYGDGSYDLYVIKKEDKVVAMRVVFIDEEIDSYEEFE